MIAAVLASFLAAGEGEILFLGETAHTVAHHIELTLINEDHIQLTADDPSDVLVVRTLMETTGRIFVRIE